jgi:hypothetical protein
MSFSAMIEPLLETATGAVYASPMIIDGCPDPGCQMAGAKEPKPLITRRLLKAIVEPSSDIPENQSNWFVIEVRRAELGDHTNAPVVEPLAYTPAVTEPS